MAGSALLEKEIEKLTGSTQELVEDVASIAEREHNSMVSQNFQNLVERREDYGLYEDSKTYDIFDRAPAYQQPEYAIMERHAPVVPNSPEAPSASSRINDFLEYQKSLNNMRMRSGDIFDRAPVQDFASLEEYAPVRDYAPVEDYVPTYEEELYRQGILMDTMLSPDTEPVEAPYYCPSYMPDTQEEDALPTRRTLETIQHNDEVENENQTTFFAALSTKTKVVLAVVTATVLLLIAVICINTAILRGINSGVAQRETQVAGLADTLTGIESEIADLISPESVESWAIEHGMTPPGS